MRRVLKHRFFSRPTLAVAKDLLGKFLVRRRRGKETAVMVCEVEAYDGPRDKASHASRGITTRNKIMFAKGGCWYVYFTYGMHWMLNIVTGPKNYPAAVLIRGAVHNEKPINGPARLTKFLRIGGSLNGKTAVRRNGLWFEDRGVRIRPGEVKRKKRVGVDYAGAWAKKPWNFSFDPS